MAPRDSSAPLAAAVPSAPEVNRSFACAKSGVAPQRRGAGLGGLPANRGHGFDGDACTEGQCGAQEAKRAEDHEVQGMAHEGTDALDPCVGGLLLAQGRLGPDVQRQVGALGLRIGIELLDHFLGGGGLANGCVQL